ncbi:MAG: hypothetical protein NOM71_04080 [Archaeoglobi archaeon]|nr:hypothetical protein [Archaeoglobi archaeon]
MRRTVKNANLKLTKCERTKEIRVTRKREENLARLYFINFRKGMVIAKEEK